MRCPSCGLAMDQTDLDRCPRCGRALATTPMHAPATTAHDATSETSGSTPGPNPYGPFQPYSSYGSPGGYGQPYGYSQPPTAPGYPPSGYPQVAQSALPVGPTLSPTRKKRHIKLIIGIVAVVVVVLAACGWGVVATIQAMHLPASSAIPRETPNEVYSNDFSSNAGGWLDDANCSLKSDGYHVSDYVCFAPVGNLSDVDIKVRVKLDSGMARGLMGVDFRLLRTGSDYNSYVFGVTGDGHWMFAKCGSGKCDNSGGPRAEGAINKGMDAENTLEIYAKGAHMDFFVNGKAVSSLDDSSYSFGRVGLECGSAMECVFTDLFIGELD